MPNASHLLARGCAKKSIAFAEHSAVLALARIIISLQVFWAHMVMAGRQHLELPPEWAAQRDRARLHAACGKQRAPGDSKHGMDHLLQPGMEPLQHLEQARRLESPFRIDQVFDTDIDFAAKGIAVWGPHIEHWRQEQTAILHRAMWALQPLTNRILRFFLRSWRVQQPRSDPPTLRSPPQS